MKKKHLWWVGMKLPKSKESSNNSKYRCFICGEIILEPSHHDSNICINCEENEDLSFWEK